ncbi:hypothetical protein EBR96_08470, partial [bacterium]|nr:hypothetical protein [bacterium]
MENGKAVTIVNLALNASRQLIPVYKGTVFWSAGFSMDIGAKSAFFSPQVGAGIRWPISSDISTRLDISQGRDFLIALGFDRRLVFDEPRRTAKLAASSGPDLQPTGNAVTVTLSVDPVRYEYYFSDVQFDDLAEHWAKNELLRVAKLGVLDPVVASDGRQIMAPN